MLVLARLEGLLADTGPRGDEVVQLPLLFVDERFDVQRALFASVFDELDLRIVLVRRQRHGQVLRDRIIIVKCAKV